MIIRLQAGVDEIGAAMKLEEFRRDTGELKDLSFDSISAAGPHGAVVHYRPTTASNLKLKPRSLYLIDSGAQYADGTTDVTRTIAIGTPSATMRRHYTLVLKAHIAIALGAVPQRHARAGYRPVRAAGRCGRQGSISTTERATASAVTSRCMNRRSASRGTAASSSSQA